MKVLARTLSKRIINFSFAFVMAFSTLTAVMPFISSDRASALPFAQYALTATEATADVEAGGATDSVTVYAEFKSFIGGWNDYWALLGDATITASVAGGEVSNDGATWGSSATTTINRYERVIDTFYFRSATTGAYPISFSTSFLTTEGNITRTATGTLNSVDTTPPVISSISTNPGTPVNNSADVIVTATDTVGLKKVSFTVEGTSKYGVLNVVGGATEDTLTKAFSDLALPDGTYTLKAAAEDLSGNYAITKSIVVTVDNTIPTFSLTDDGSPRTAIADGAIVNPSLLGDVDSNGNTIRFYKESTTDRIFVNDVLLFGHGYVGGHSGQIGARFATDGLYTVYTKDAASNQSSTISFTVDTLPPVVDNVTVDKGLTNEDTLTVNGTVTDVNLKNYNIRVYNEDKSSVVSPWIGYTGVSEVPGGELAILNISSLTDGNYWVRIWADDLAGNRTGISSHIYVPFTVDTTAPVITITVGDQTIEAGDTYIDQGATWTDNVDAGGEVLDVTNNVNPSVPGTYEVIYTVTDTAGNTATESRTVTVEDTTAPVITLTGTDVTLTVGDAYVDEGATWTDFVDGSGIAVLSGAVDTSTEGVYVLTYNYTDAAGNAATPVTRTVTVEPLSDDGDVLGEDDENENNDEDNANNDEEIENQVVFQNIITEDNSDEDTTAPEETDTDTSSTETGTDSEVQGEADENNGGIFGLAWYWWLLILGALAAFIWWLIGALRSRNQEQE